jgi:hypothetical protein
MPPQIVRRLFRPESSERYQPLLAACCCVLRRMIVR